ncbi:MAG TPA: non-homologous end-joining DNA ligase [Thermoanaerobaculia bacterium]|nr:non-homologous end-joining DNA ligase [Thermoanaerobaculia bacterium]
MTVPRPMLATPVDAPFTRAGWVFEPKYDGWRVLARRQGGRVSLFSRNGVDLTRDEPGIAAALAPLAGGDFLVDGELVVFGKRGVPEFSLLQKRGEKGARPASLVLFDCLERDGASLVSRPLSERRQALESLTGRRPKKPLALAARLGADGEKAYRRAAAEGWEGVVGKDLASSYEAGRRSLRWLKVKARREAEFVIGGFTLPRGGRLHFGALLVGLYEGAALRFCGAVGTGFSERTLLDLLERLSPQTRETCPFTAPPKEAKDPVWVEPRLVAQVAYAEWTADERLRQPAFLGLRLDKAPPECRWEERET